MALGYALRSSPVERGRGYDSYWTVVYGGSGCQNSEWLAHTPRELVMAHLHIDKATFDAIPKNGVSVTPLS